jgi:hypothetical protein
VPRRGGKISDWEGGVRVAAFLSGGALASSLRGTKRDGTIAIADLHATICSLAGVPVADSAPLARGLPPVDGLDLLPYLTGTAATSPRVELPLSCLSASTIFPGNSANMAIADLWSGGALIVGDHKIIYGTQLGMGYLQGPVYPNGSIVPTTGPPHNLPLGRGCGPPPAYNATGPWAASSVHSSGASGASGASSGALLKPCLFNIRADPSESHDLLRTLRPSKEVVQLLAAMEAKYVAHCGTYFQSTHIFADEKHNTHPTCVTVEDYIASHHGFKGVLCT